MASSFLDQKQKTSEAKWVNELFTTVYKYKV